MKKRNPGIVFLLMIVTFGVYWIIWHIKFQDELREESAKGILPVGHIMLMLFVPVGGIIYYFVWLMTVESHLFLAGAPAPNRWWLHLILFLLGIGVILSPVILQAKANKIGTVDQNAQQTTAESLVADKYAKYKIGK